MENVMHDERSESCDWEYQLTRDPRAATYWEDSWQWVWLKQRIYEDPRAGDELLGGIDFIRCHGARIIPGPNGGYRIGRGECPGDVYDEVRASVLQANAVLIQRLFRSMPSPRWTSPCSQQSA